MRPQPAEPIGASGQATTASPGRTHDRKQPIIPDVHFPLASRGAGGSTYRPTMSWSLAGNSGSLDSLKRLTRCGCRPCTAQIRCTERNEMPAAWAIARPVQ
jgi:hypothetical protein